MSLTSRLRARLAPSAYVTGSVAVVVVVLALAAVAAPEVLAFALAAGGAVLAWGWAGTLDLPSPRGTLGVIMVGGLALVGIKETGTPVPIWYPVRLLGTVAGLMLVYGTTVMIVDRYRAFSG